MLIIKTDVRLNINVTFICISVMSKNFKPFNSCFLGICFSVLCYSHSQKIKLD